MTDVVLDANVAVKLVIELPHSDRAQQIFEETRSAGGRLIGPPVLIDEVVNSIFQYRRTRDPQWQISEREAEAALVRFLDLPLSLPNPEQLHLQAFTFARDHALNGTYDSVYVVLAQLLGVEMWTDDQRLLRDLGGSAPWVRSLRDYPIF